MAKTKKSIDDMILEANKLIGKKKHKKALAIYIQVVEKRPNDYKSWVKVGDCLRQLGDDAQALKIYKRTANSLAAEGQLMQAIAVNKLVLEIDPKHTATQERLAGLYAARKEAVKEEQQAFRDALDKEVAEHIGSGESTDEQSLGEFDDSEDAITTHRFDIALEQQTAADISDDEIRKRLSAMPDTPLFSDLSAQQFAAVIPKLGFRRVSEGDHAVREGDIGESLFIIADGSARVAKKNEEGKDVYLGTMGPGAFFGEVALFEGGIRSASVIAADQLSLLEITQDSLYELTSEFPQIEAVMNLFYQQRLLRTILRFSDPFRTMPEPHLMSAIRRFKHAAVGAGMTLQAGGNVTSGLTVIESGSVLGHGEGGEPERLGPGDYIGLASFLSNQPSSVTYESATDVRLYNLPRDVFGALVKKYPEVLERLKAIA